MAIHDDNKAAMKPLLAARAAGDAKAVRRHIAGLVADEAVVRFCAPFGALTGGDALWDSMYRPLFSALPDLEFRDFILMAGPRWGGSAGGNWVGIGGNIVGTFTAPWLGIPATHRPVFLRYHEYLRVEAGRVVEIEAIWDIPQLMIQAGAWPLAPQDGVEWMCPGPADGGGMSAAPYDAAASSASVQLVWDMLHDLKQADAATPGRGLGGYWHDHAMWYGPAGIGTARGHTGIRDTVLRGFRSGLSDNTRHLDDGVFFADGDLVAFTGWPSGTATHSGDGFLGLAPTGKRFTRRSLDFWRIEDGLIRENWVLVDLIDVYRQLGVDVFAGMNPRGGRAGEKAA